MSSGADLFVVCKRCGSEVSPYITECPYCGHRLRRRAPKLPRENAPTRSPRGLSRVRLRLGRTSKRPLSRSGTRGFAWAHELRSGLRPYATIVLVAASCGAWIAWHAKPGLFAEMAIIGPLGGDWWKLLTSPFAYGNGLYEFVALVAIAIFGWLLERRHGPVVVLALFFAGGATGALAASAVYAEALVSGGNGGALALLAAWAIPDLEAVRAGAYYEGDLLGAGALAAVLLAMPFAVTEASWLAGVTGAVLGVVVGFGLWRLGRQEL
jgi:membrane associated rhomboid family serine protease